MKKRSFMRVMAMILAACMLFGNAGTVFAEEKQMNNSEINQEEGIKRLCGSNRYETSYAIAFELKEQDISIQLFLRMVITFQMLWRAVILRV